MHKIGIIVPSFNEAGSLFATLTEITDALEKLPYESRIIVINDGSTDDTKNILGKISLSSSKEIILLNLAFNCGVGAAVRSGYIYCKQNSIDFAIQIDADGQHPADQIDLLLRELLSGSDVVIGSRFLMEKVGADHTSQRRIVVLKILALIMSRLCDSRITDSTSGFRGVNKSVITIYSDCYPSEYLGDTLNSLIIASKLGFKIKEVPADMRPRLIGKRSQNRIKSLYFLIRALFGIFIMQTQRRNYLE